MCVEGCWVMEGEEVAEVVQVWKLKRRFWDWWIQKHGPYVYTYVFVCVLYKKCYQNLEFILRKTNIKLIEEWCVGKHEESKTTDQLI